MRPKRLISTLLASAALITSFLSSGVGTEDETDLAKQLSNPIASLTSVPFQLNYDDNIGVDDDGSLWRLNFQPVIPVSISNEWNMISRTILPVIDQDNIPSHNMGESGIGDTLQNFFFSPKEPTSSGLVWGVGPALLLDTASHDALGGEKWAAGPTGVALKQDGPWTYGVLANHLESFAGNDNRPDVSATYVQPFFSYVTEKNTTFGLNLESTYDWENHDWSVPVNLTAMQLIKVGDQMLQVGGGVRYWLDSSSTGPEGWGARFQITYLFPK